MSSVNLSERMVPGFTLHAVLATAQTVAGPQYGSLLKVAGLERWLGALPPATMEPAATEAELARLFAAAYAKLGDAGTRLMMRNWGTELAPMIIGNPMVQEFIAEVSKLPEPERLPAAMRHLQQIAIAFWAPAAIREDSTAWYLTLRACPVCADIHGAQNPICTSGEPIFSRLLQAMTGRRLTVQETACRALGATGCTYTITK